MEKAQAKDREVVCWKAINMQVTNVEALLCCTEIDTESASTAQDSAERSTSWPATGSGLLRLLCTACVACDVHHVGTTICNMHMV